MKMPLITLILAKVYKQLDSFSQRPKRKKIKVYFNLFSSESRRFVALIGNRFIIGLVNGI